VVQRDVPVSAPLFYWLSGFVLLGALCFVLKDEARQKAHRIMLLYTSTFVLWALVFSAGIQGRLSHPTAIMEADKAELLLKFGTAMYVVEHRLVGHGGAAGVFGPKPDPQAAANHQKNFHQEAEKILKESLDHNPDSSTLKVKLAILLADSAQPADHKEALALAHELACRRVKKDSNLGRALEQIYGRNQLVRGLEGELARTVIAGVPYGWYRDACLLRLYKDAGDGASYDNLRLRIEDKAAGLFINLLTVLCFGLTVALIGSIIIVVQLFLWPGRLEAQRYDAFWRAEPAWNLRTVYVVFISWLATQIGIGSVAQQMVKSMGLLSSGPILAAVSTASIYALSNAPALFYIYWFACRPAQLNFRTAIRLRFHSGQLGPGRLFLVGLATWCAAVPLVMIAYLAAAKFLGAQGSSNPIIALVLDAARSSNHLATVLFYLTLGLLAPLCEESLFRGFLYSSLRRRFGIGTSLFVSATLFAAVHLDAGAIVPLLCLGWVFGFVFERTRSIVPSMVAHGLWNSGTFTLVLMVFS